MDKIILTDMDDVLVSWVGGFAAWFKKHHNPDFDAISEPSSWDMSKWLNRTSEECIALVHSFNSGDFREFAELPATKGSVDAVNLLKDMGYRFVVITAATDKPAAIRLREENLHNLFGDAIVKSHIIGLRDSKLPYLQEYQPTLWIDDKHTHAVHGSKAGHRSLLMDQPHNVEFSGPYQRVKDWQDVVAHAVNVHGVLSYR